MTQLNPEKSIKSWLEKFDEDFLAAKELLKSGRYTWCAFACQQAVEKYLKAAYVKKFSEYYLTARYPSYKESVNIQNKKEARAFFKKAEDAIQWLQKHLNV